MTIYHVETQEDYNALMIELENKGCMWHEEKPTAKNHWLKNEEKTYVMEENGYLTYGCMELSYRELYSKEPFIDYKAKGEKMTQQEEMKQKIHEVAFDTCVAIATFTRGTLTVESDLLEARSSAKKLIEKIDEYLETLKHKFKVGDYVIEQNGNVISKIEKVLNDDFWGPYYKKIDNHFGNLGSNIFVENIERLATPEEILEYESALIFNKHGRNPFELKKGDLIRTPSGKNTFVLNPKNYTKEGFLDCGWKLIKTVEEVNEWL